MTHDEEREDMATEEAAGWLLALEDNPADRTVRAHFQDWLDRDPRHAAAWADASKIYGLVARVPPAHAEHWERIASARKASGPTGVESGDRPHPSRRTEARHGGGTVRRRRTGRRGIALGAAAFVLAAAVAFVAMPSLLLRLQADYRTSTGEMRSFRLADGSTVRLAPGSAVSVAAKDGDRGVRLLRGEAFFDVVTDSRRPFRVVADSLTATVLGTQFNVRLGEGLAGVAVRAGRVGVRRATATSEASFVLAAGDWLRIGDDDEIRRGHVPAADVGSWMEGRIIARDRAMSDVLDDLRRQYAGFILLTDAALGARRVTGVYDLQDPVASVRLLAAPLGAEVRTISPWLVLVSPG